LGEGEKTDTSYNRDNYNYLKIVQKIPQQITWKAHQGTTENIPTGHCTHTSESIMQQHKTFIKGYSITGTQNCNQRTAVTLYSLGTWFVLGI